MTVIGHPIEIAVARVDYECVGVDVPGDVARVEALIRQTVESLNRRIVESSDRIHDPAR